MGIVSRNPRYSLFIYQTEVLMSGILTVLDVIVGLAFIYLLLSLITSAAVEYLEIWLKKRGRFLYMGISELVAYTEKGIVNREITGQVVDKLYRNPLIFRLYHGEPNIGLSMRGSNLPSYIPPATFVAALIDELAKNPAKEAPQDAPKKLPKTVEGLDSVVAESGLLSQELKRALRTVVNAQENFAAAVKALEAWYVGTTERVSGWYRRHTQMLSFLISLVIVAGWNIDTVYIAQSLLVNPALRGAIVAAAGEHVHSTAVVAEEQGKAAKPASEEEVEDRIKSLRDKLYSLGFPIGWSQMSGPWWEHIPGWLLSAVAISFGAPFWFEVLNRVMQFRSTLKPKLPEETEEGRKTQ